MCRKETTKYEELREENKKWGKYWTEIQKRNSKEGKYKDGGRLKGEG